MSAWDFLQMARQRGIELSFFNADLKFRAPKGALDAELLQGLKSNKEEILEILRRGSLTLIDRKPVKEIVRQSLHMIWFIDSAGQNWRYFPHLARSFPIQVVQGSHHHNEAWKGGNFTSLIQKKLEYDNY